MLKVLVEGLLDLLWPPRTTCLLCEGALDQGRSDLLVCKLCWEAMPFPVNLPLCRQCSRPLKSGWGWCADCADGQPYDQVWALGLHRGALREAVHHLKFGRREELGRPLGERMAPLICRKYDLVIPVPLHPSRLRQRGYNQAGLVAAGIAAELGLPLVDGSLVRLRRTGHQAKLERHARLRNLNGAFHIVQSQAGRLVGRSILLVDDVLTTGATATAAAEAIRRGGAERVDLAVLAVSEKPVRLARYGPANRKITRG